MKIIVFTPSDRRSKPGEQHNNRHEKIMSSLKQYELVDHTKLKYATEQERKDSLKSIDIVGNIVIAHYTDLHPNGTGLFEELQELENAIGVFHNYNYPDIARDDIYKYLIPKKNILFANSESVIKNIDEFVEEYLKTKSLKSASVKLRGKDEEEEALLRPFEIASPIDGSMWRSKLILAKGKLNEYLQNN